MLKYRILTLSGVSFAAGALGAYALQEAAEPPAGETPPQETAEQIAARELCTETAARGAHPGWSLKEGKTCENSFAETCTVIRNADKLQASYVCYTPLPPLEEETAEPDADDPQPE